MINSLPNLSFVGLLGDLIVPVDSNLISKYICEGYSLIKKYQSHISTRGDDYYRDESCEKIFCRLKVYFEYYEKLNCTDSFCSLPSKYILVDHLLSGLIRIIDTIISLDLDNHLVTAFINVIDSCAKELVFMLIGGDRVRENINFDKLILPKDVSNLRPRRFMEGDNHILSLSSSLTSCVDEAYVGILFGGGSSAAIMAAYNNSQLNYIKFSNYDSLEMNSDKIWGSSISSKNTVCIVDDNCGTGKTLKKVKDIIDSEYHISSKITAVEFHWEKYLRVHGYGHKDSIFSPDEFDYLSPWCFRHHKVVNDIMNNHYDGKAYHTSLNDWINYSISTLSIIKDTSGIDFNINYLLEIRNIQNKDNSDVLNHISKNCSCSFCSKE